MNDGTKNKGGRPKGRKNHKPLNALIENVLYDMHDHMDEWPPEKMMARHNWVKDVQAHLDYRLKKKEDEEAGSLFKGDLSDE